MSVFLDTNIVVYLIERTPGFWPNAVARIQSLLSQGERLVVSDLVRMECRVRPLRLDDPVTLAAFDGYFGSEQVDVVPITAAVCDRAAAIRARDRFRAMDALHLAAAIEHGCQRFLTQDFRLGGYPDITIEVLSRT